MFPIRCYTCNTVLAHLHDRFEQMSRHSTAVQSFERLRIERMCCRRMFLGYVNVTSDLIRYPNVNVQLDGDAVLMREVSTCRVVECD